MCFSSSQSSAPPTARRRRLRRSIVTPLEDETSGSLTGHDIAPYGNDVILVESRDAVVDGVRHGECDTESRKRKSDASTPTASARQDGGHIHQEVVEIGGSNRKYSGSKRPRRQSCADHEERAQPPPPPPPADSDVSATTIRKRYAAVAKLCFNRSRSISKVQANTCSASGVLCCVLHVCV